MEFVAILPNAAVFHQFPLIPMNALKTKPLYTFEDLRLELDRIREGGMPRSTLYHWLRSLRILPGKDGYYTEDDLFVLEDLHRFLQRCPSIKKFERVYFS